MADNVLGVQATINSKDVQQGANEFIAQINRMESATSQFSHKLSGHAHMVNGEVREMGNSFDSVVATITKGASALGAAFSAQQFTSQVMKVRGEFQQLEVAFNTMLGSAEKASELMSQLTRTAAVTPFGLQDVAGGAKQLLAYGVASEQVNDTLVRLGDIAAGLSIPLNDLVYLYGTTMTQGRMFTQDLRQFQGRGIPLADELAKQFGVTKDKVGELVTAGRVGFEEMNKAIISMTSEGGKFGGLMEAQSKTITGQISNIEDAIDGMFNEIGKSSEGAINAALGGVSALVENWQKVADAIGLAVASYGSYKAAVMVTDAVQSVRMGYSATEEINGLKELLEIKEEVRNSDLDAAVASGRLSAAKAAELASLRAETQARLEALMLKKQETAEEENIAQQLLSLAQKEKEAADERVANMEALYEAAQAQSDASYEAYALEQLQTASEAANTAATRVNTAEKNYNAAASASKAAAEAADTMAVNANTVANRANATSMNIMKAAALQLTTILRGMWASLMANPLALVVGAVAALTYGIYKLATAESEAEKATKKRNEELEQQAALLEENLRKVEQNISKLKDIATSDIERVESLAELRKMYPKIFEQYDIETIKLANILDLKKQISEEEGRKNTEARETEIEDLENRIEYLKKLQSHNLTERQRNDLQSQIDRKQIRLDTLLEERGSIISEQFISSLKNLDDETIDKYVRYIEGRIRGVGKDSKVKITLPIDVEGNLSQEAVYKVGDLKALIETANTRKGGEKNKSTYQKDLAKAKKDWEEAKAGYEALIKSQTSTTTEVEKARQTLEEKEKAYQDLGGDVKGKQLKEEAKTLKERGKIEEEVLDMRRENAQEELNLLKESAEKKRKQIELNWQKEIDAINKQKKEWEDAQGGKLTEEQDALISQRTNIANRKKIQSEKSLTDSLIGEYKSYAQQRFEIEEQYNKDIAELQVARAEAQKRGDIDTANKITAAIAKATSDRGKALMSFDLDKFKASPEYIKAFEDLGNASTETLEKIISELERMKQSAAEGYDIENFKEFSDMLMSISDELIVRNPFKSLHDAQVELLSSKNELNEYEKVINELKNGSKVVKSQHMDEETGELVDVYWTLEEALLAYKLAKDRNIITENKFQKSLNETLIQVDKLAQSIDNLSGVIGGAAGEIVSLIGGVLSFSTSTVDSIVKVTATGANALSSLEKASVILALASAAMQTFSKISDLANNSSYKQYESYANKIQEINALTDATNKYRLAVLEAQQAESSWFASDNLAELRRNKSLQNEINDQYFQKLSEQQAKYENQSGGGWWTTIYKAAFRPFSLLKDAAGDYEKQTVKAIENLRIETRAASKGFLGSGIGAKDQRTQDLREWVRNKGFGELFDEQDRLNKEAAEVILEQYGNKLVGETKATLEALLELQEQYDEFVSQLKEYVSSMYEPLVDNFVDSIWAWFDEGKDALDEFKSYASGTFRDIANEMLRSLVISTVFDSYEEDIEKMYEAYSNGKLTERELMNQVAQRTNMLAKAAEEQIPMLQNVVTSISDTLKDVGYDISQTGGGVSSVSASSRSIASMSQDTADELNGRFTALQIAGEEIKAQTIQQTLLIDLMGKDTTAIKEQINIQNQYISEIVDIQYESVGYLSEINKSTKQLYEMNERLAQIEENTRNI